MTYIWKAASETDGSGLDLSCSDEISGNLVCGCGIVKMERGMYVECECQMPGYCKWQ